MYSLKEGKGIMIIVNILITTVIHEWPLCNQAATAEVKTTNEKDFLPRSPRAVWAQPSKV